VLPYWLKLGLGFKVLLNDMWQFDLNTAPTFKALFAHQNAWKLTCCNADLTKFPGGETPGPPQRVNIYSTQLHGQMGNKQEYCANILSFSCTENLLRHASRTRKLGPPWAPKPAHAPDSKSLCSNLLEFLKTTWTQGIITSRGRPKFGFGFGFGVENRPKWHLR
jgi:hypothetical protein